MFNYSNVLSIVSKPIQGMVLKYEGCSQFRQRIVAATLSGKPLKIVKIREEDESPGLQDFEANFLRLIEKLCDGKWLSLSGFCLDVSRVQDAILR